MTGGSEMAQLAREKVSKALDNVTIGISGVARTADEEAVHKLRVSIRRFSQAIRVFRQYVPRRPSRRIQRRLRTLMRAAGEVRDRDIAMKLLAGTVDLTQLKQEREAAQQELTSLAGSIYNSRTSRRWRERLLNGGVSALEQQ